MNLIIIFDSSNDISITEFSKQMRFLSNFVRTSLNEDNLIGILGYGYYTLNFDLSLKESKDMSFNDISLMLNNSIHYGGTDNINIGVGLILASNMIKEQGNPNYNNAIILLSNGNVYDSDNFLCYYIKNILFQQNIILYNILINSNINKFNCLTNNDRTINIKTYQDNDMNSGLSVLSSKICRDVGYDTSKPTQSPSILPTITPTITPSITPSITPTMNPSIQPSLTPIKSPTNTPTMNIISGDQCSPNICDKSETNWDIQYLGSESLVFTNVRCFWYEVTIKTIKSQPLCFNNYKQSNIDYWVLSFPNKCNINPTKIYKFLRNIYPNIKNNNYSYIERNNSINFAISYDEITDTMGFINYHWLPSINNKNNLQQKYALCFDNNIFKSNIFVSKGTYSIKSVDNYISINNDINVPAICDII